MDTSWTQLLQAVAKVWLDIGHRVLYMSGLVLLVVVIGAAIYAQWISPEADVNDVVNNQLLGQLPNWWPYVLLAIGIPFILLLATALMPGWVLMVVMGLGGVVGWVYRRIRRQVEHP